MQSRISLCTIVVNEREDNDKPLDLSFKNSGNDGGSSERHNITVPADWQSSEDDDDETGELRKQDDLPLDLSKTLYLSFTTIGNAGSSISEGLDITVTIVRLLKEKLLKVKISYLPCQL